MAAFASVNGLGMTGRIVESGVCSYGSCEELGESCLLEPWPIGARPLKWLSHPGTLLPDSPAAEQPAGYPLLLCHEHLQLCQGKQTRVVRSGPPVADRLRHLTAGVVISIELI
jgi:hypothetical protein